MSKDPENSDPEDWVAECRMRFRYGYLLRMMKSVMFVDAAPEERGGLLD